MWIMIRSRLAAIGWGGRESLPSLSSWVLAVVLGGVSLVVGVFVLAVTPYGPWFGEVPRTHPSGNSIVEYFLTSPVHLALVLVPAALVLWIARLDRGREDRYDRLALLAVVLAALGMATSFASVKPIWLYMGEWRPFGLVALAVASCAASAIVSLISLLVLFSTRSPRRGRAFVMFTLVWSSWLGALLYAFVLVPRDLPPEVLGDVELPVVSEGVLIDYWDLNLPREYWPRGVLRIHADGEVEWEGESIASIDSPEGREALRQMLTRIVARMPVERGRPDETLMLRADHRVSAGVPATILSMCAEEEIGIWKVAVDVRLDRIQEGLPNWGRISTYLPRDAQPMISSAVEIRAAEDATRRANPVFQYEGQELHEARELVAVLLERDRSSLERFWEGAVPLVRIDPRLPWGAVAKTLSELLLLNPGHGDKCLNLVGMEVLER